MGMGERWIIPSPGARCTAMSNAVAGGPELGCRIAGSCCPGDRRNRVSWKFVSPVKRRLASGLAASPKHPYSEIQLRDRGCRVHLAASRERLSPPCFRGGEFQPLHVRWDYRVRCQAPYGWVFKERSARNQTVAVVVLRRTGENVVVEISYTYGSWASATARATGWFAVIPKRGYWTGKKVRWPQPMRSSRIS